MAQPRKIICAGVRIGPNLGYSGLAYALAMTRKPTSPFDVTRVIGLGHKKASSLLRQLWLFKRVHRCGWIKPKHGFPTPIYKFGPGEDAPAMIGADGLPHAYADMRPKRFDPRIVAFCSLLDALDLGPSSVEELARQSGVAESRVRKALTVMNAPAVRLAYIESHQARTNNSGIPTSLWVSGSGKNAEPPAPARHNRKTRNARTADIAKGAWVNTVLELRRGSGIERPKVYAATTGAAAGAATFTTGS